MLSYDNIVESNLLDLGTWKHCYRNPDDQTDCKQVGSLSGLSKPLEDKLKVSTPKMSVLVLNCTRTLYEHNLISTVGQS